MHGAMCLVFLPRAPGNVAAHDDLDGKDSVFADLHGAAAEGWLEGWRDGWGKGESEEVGF
jgi:hypothetical protein